MDVFESHKKLQAQRKLNIILRSNAISDSPIQVGDSVQLYIPGSHGKKGKLLLPRPVTSYDLKSRNVTVPGSNNRLLTAGIEDVRISTEDDDLGQLLTEAIDNLDECI